jgi:hypothetical protein
MQCVQLPSVSPSAPVMTPTRPALSRTIRPCWASFCAIQLRNGLRKLLASL